jgi:NADH:ubiquinone oxidoreductase subunit 5 (subunit L)/multisubunit Na+/H+ antiporter MnhA subunit
MDAARAVFTFDSRIVDGAVNGLAALSRLFSRIVGGIDKYLVDGLVNSIAAFVARLMSPLFRAAQTGFTQNYALVMVLGLMIGIIAFYGADIARAAADAAAAIKGMFGVWF